MYALLVVGWTAVILTPLIWALDAIASACDRRMTGEVGTAHLVHAQSHALIRLALLMAPTVLVGTHLTIASAVGTEGASPMSMTMTAGGLASSHRAVPVLLALLALVWVAGTVRLAARALVAIWQERELRASSVPVSNALTQRLEIAKQRMRLSTVVSMREADVDSPMVVGRRSPMILVPRARWWTATEQVDALLLHELAHLVRGDARGNLWLLSASMVFWWHPSMWRLLGIAHRARECACDDMAISMQGSPVPLATALVSLAERREQQRPKMSLAAIGHPLLYRVKRLVAQQQPVRSALWPRDTAPRRIDWSFAMVLTGATLSGVTLSGITLRSARAHADTQRAFARSVLAPSVPMTIHAHDDAGAFRVIMRRGRVEGVVMGSDSVIAPRLVAHGDSLRVTDASGAKLLTLSVDPRGVIGWNSRRPITSVSQ